ncbi:phenylalanine--tRNA ligase subunit beta [bacterium]|nr:MAG: phenylalanine--tRNA ligase subunit beta [bacterium]
MRVPLGWLKAYVDVTESADEAAEIFARLGFPVDAVERAPRVEGVVIGEIVALEKHPNADRLLVGTISVGNGAPLTIATGATNVAVGQRIPVATIGSHLPEMKIERRTMRGIVSEGMMCSARELGLEPEHFEDGIMILDGEAAVGANAVAALGLAQAVLDLDVTPNRPDCLSVLGLAREYAAAMRRTLRLPELYAGPYAAPSEVRVVLEGDGCNRYVAQRFENVRVGAAPAWMRVRLSLAGQRPISNLVDISNYVMLEVGQPLHFFDWESVAGGTIIVRKAHRGEHLLTLDGVERELDERVLLICDGAGPSVIAGIRGGERSEVKESTRSLLMESANFDGPTIRRGSLSLGLRTDGSLRHEKSLPLSFADFGAARAAKLLANEGATINAPLATGQPVPAPAHIAFPVAQVPRVLGLSLPLERVASNLQALGFATTPLSGETLDVEVPPWRADVHENVDLVEEVARIESYDEIPSELPPIAQHGINSDDWHLESDIAHALMDRGYREIVSLPLHSSAILEKYRNAGIELPRPPVEVLNPLSEEQRWLRFAILPLMLQWLSRNCQELPRRVFEIGHAFRGEAPITEETIAGIIFAPAERPEKDEPVWRDRTLLEFRGEIESLLRGLTGISPKVAQDAIQGMHPGKTASLLLDHDSVAMVGRVDPRLCATFEVPLSTYYAFLRVDKLPARSVAAYKPVPKFPGTSRDLALLLDENVPAEAVLGAVLQAHVPQLERARPFDEYRGPQVPAGKKSMTVRIWLREPESTITDAIADRATAKIVAALRERVGAELRT